MWFYIIAPQIGNKGRFEGLHRYVSISPEYFLTEDVFSAFSFIENLLFLLHLDPSGD